MARPISWAFAALLAMGTPVAAAAEWCDPADQQAAQSQQGKNDKDKGQSSESRDSHRSRWWSDPKRRAELGITDQQSAAIEQIWQKGAPGLREIWGKLQKLEETLATMTRDDNVHEKAVIAQIEVVEDTRAEGNKRRTAMLYRMMRRLTPDQRAKVKAMYEARDQQRRAPATSR
jgi:Spy/CpxP family protein refolding chaperone